MGGTEGCQVTGNSYTVGGWGGQGHLVDWQWIDCTLGL